MTDAIYSPGPDLDWSEWTPIFPTDDLKQIPKEAGIYRVLHPKSGAIYLIARSKTDIRNRVQKLGQSIRREECPGNDPHTAGPTLWEVKQDLGKDFFVSWCPIDKVDEVDGKWTACLARHHACNGMSPLANFGSSVNIRGKDVQPAEGTETSSGKRLLYKPIKYKIDWENWQNVSSDDWMGLEWSDEFSKDSHIDPFPRDSGVFRARKQGSNRLAYIGASTDIHNSIYNSNKVELPDDANISYYQCDIYGTPKKNELQAILLGAHYIAEKSAPKSRIETASSIKKQAKGIIDRGEDSDVEFKEELDDHESICLEIIALANDGGGHLFIGVSDCSEIKGLSEIDDIEGDIKNWCRDDINPSINIDSYRPNIDGKDILWIKIPPARNMLYNFRGRFQRRNATHKDGFQWADFERFLKQNPHVPLRILQELESDVDLGQYSSKDAE
ncbi:helix-turn-helix domain-containing protein [Haloarcula sp. CBA1127]|uniref:AlbA family DNA-binding domain-containing protein n=1 Tax=Haloarcula sp. CBA1127 TaxID=1765055 RepID=UPI0009ACC48E|nr:ATP-binding protein [Haloarcula sp. CBA1127]